MNKPEKRLLRQIVDNAYRADLDAAPRDLDASFDQWRAGGVDCFDITDAIHKVSSRAGT